MWEPSIQARETLHTQAVTLYLLAFIVSWLPHKGNTLSFKFLTVPTLFKRPKFQCDLFTVGPHENLLSYILAIHSDISTPLPKEEKNRKETLHQSKIETGQDEHQTF